MRPFTTAAMQAYKIISWDDATECALSCAGDLDWAAGQAAAAANPSVGDLFDTLPPELKIDIWKLALLAEEKSVQYELLFRLPHHGGATARVVTPSPQGYQRPPHHDTRQREQQRAQREQRIQSFASLSREALVAVRDTYVWLPRYHFLGGRGGRVYGSAVAPRRLDSRDGSWACPAIDRFSWAMTMTTMTKMTAKTTWNDFVHHHHHQVVNSNSNSNSNSNVDNCLWQLLLPQPLPPSAACGEYGFYRHPSMPEFLSCCLQMPDTPSHPMYPWPGRRDLYAKFCLESVRLLRAVRYLDLTLPALLVQSSGQAATRGMEAFPQLRSVAISVSTSRMLPPSPETRAAAAAAAADLPAAASGPTVLGGIDRAAWQSYVRQNDPWVKVSLGLVLSRRYKGLDAEIPEAWGCLAGVPPCAGFQQIYRHVALSVMRAESVYGVGRKGWVGFLEFYRLLIQRGVDVFIVSGHNTQWVKPLSY